ncbi:LEA type 2 family protein [Salarchaeum japonicum]|uniref:Water stress and hypersensitive response domain-containing protein n=1 Tax=Salarchaeum japonicum TaxID=555573 RepID=A0AAV3T389_9EURY|nr:LEA type 2 family protein [Salarchaeum japonicum]
MDVRSLLFGSTIRVALTVVLGLGVVAGGAVVTGVVGVPSVASMDNGFGEVTNDTTAVNTELVVHNPNPIGIRLGDTTVNYSVLMNDVTVATGSKSGFDIDTGNTSINLTTYLQNDRIPDWWVTHIRNEETTSLVVNADVHSGLLGRTFNYQTGGQTISTDIISQFNSSETRAVNSGSVLVDDPLFYVNRTNASWGEVSSAETPIDMEFLVHNPKDAPLGVSKIGYNITMNDISVGSGELDKGVVVPPHASKEVEATTAIRNQRLDEWWVSHLRNDQVTNLTIDFYAVIEPPVEGASAMRIPLRDLTYTRTIETNIFRDDPGNDTSDDATTTTSDDTTTSDGTTTAGTTTEDGTTTDDGGVLDGDTTTTTSDGGTTTAGTTTEDDGILSVSQGGTFMSEEARVSSMARSTQSPGRVLRA